MDRADRSRRRGSKKRFARVASMLRVRWEKDWSRSLISRGWIFRARSTVIGGIRPGPRPLSRRVGLSAELHSPNPVRSVPEAPGSGGKRSPGEGHVCREAQDIADMNSLCPLVVARLPMISVSHVAELLSTATGLSEDLTSLKTKVSHALTTETSLVKVLGGKSEKADLLPWQVLQGRLGERSSRKKVSEYDPSRDHHCFQNEETGS